MHSPAKCLSLLSVLLLPNLALGRSTPDTSSDPELTLEEYWTFVQSSTALRHGDSCSWEAEVARQDEFRQSQNLFKSSPLRAQLLKEFIKKSLEKKMKYCTAINKLVCDQVTETCVCGEAASQVGLGDAYKPSSYVLEKNDEGHSFCRLAKGTACYPLKNTELKTNFANILAKAGLETGPGCAKGLDCLAQGKGYEGQLCTNTTYMEYTYEHMYGVKDALTYGEAKDNFLTGKVCACQEAESQNELIRDDKFGKETGDGRRNKRSAEEEESRLFESVLNVWSPRAI